MTCATLNQITFDQPPKEHKMKEQTTNKSTNDFLKTDGGKTKSNAIETPSISLPKGGGAIKGIDEKFSVNAINGTSSFSIPLPFSPARGITPQLALGYNSGAGNGAFGLGWNLSLSTIKRKTDKGLPQYLDTIDSDVFLFSEAEDLVPKFKKTIPINPQTPGETETFEFDDHGDYILDERDSPDGSFKIRNYIPRVEGLFARIERWRSKATDELKWRVITRDNTTSLFGWTAQARISDPSNAAKIFEWLPEFVFDDKGNCAQYIYKKENKEGLDSNLIHNRNRIKNNEITYTNTYLKKVVYGNRTPYKQFGDPFPLSDDYFFSTVFDYGEHDELLPEKIIKNWDFRIDAFSDYKAGFEIRTTRSCKRVLLFHHFKGQGEYEGLVTSLNFSFDTSSEEDFTFLKSATQIGSIKKPDGTYSSKSLPPMEFLYQKHEWNNTIKNIHSDELVNAPEGIEGTNYQFTDLYNEGLSGILSEQAGTWYYKQNLGNGEFDHTKLVANKPSFSGLGSTLHLGDLDADGGKQLVAFGTEIPGYFEVDEENDWQNFQPFKSLPTINFGDPNTRMIDLNGDGKPEVIISQEQVFTWYPSEGKEGFSSAQKVAIPTDEEDGPRVVFSEVSQTIYLADMSGDGMIDIVRIKNGNVCYWPNLGYGNFGPKISVDQSPVFDTTDNFNAAYIRLVDIDGSGTSDIVYLGKNKFTCWKNLSGNRFGKTPFEIDPFPEIDSTSRITTADILGNGLPCIVWSSSLQKNERIPLKYIDLLNSKKPHIMIGYQNNMGKEVSMKYKPSTHYYLQDKKAGKPWVTKLHFPVYCVDETITEDKISGYRFVSKYQYHHGYYDHAEREFRGFGMVEQTDSETFENWKKSNATNIVEESLHQEPVITKSWSHTGAFLQNEKILSQFSNDYWYNEIKRFGFSPEHHEIELPDAKLIVAQGLELELLNQLSAVELREGYRACKGMGLRSEVFAKDAVKYGSNPEDLERELIPYSVATNNCFIQLIQPKGQNKHAVFTVVQSEAISYTYERNPKDPRIAHNLNLKLDKYGQILESVAVVYPRLIVASELPAETKLEQAKTTIIYSQNRFTKDIISDNIYRLPMPAEVKTFDLKNVLKAHFFYSPSDFEILFSENDPDVVLYHEFDKPFETNKAQIRLIEHVCSTYYNDDLNEALPLYHLGSKAIAYESYQLAYTPELINDIFGEKVGVELLLEGKFTHSEGDKNWWIRSGTSRFISTGETSNDAQNRFYAPLAYIDPYGAETQVRYYKDYFLFIEETIDALGNISGVEKFNFRTLSPQKMRDINGNFSEAISDELGMVKAIAILGKGFEADQLDEFSEVTSIEEVQLKNDFFNAPNSEILVVKGKALLKGASTCFVYDFENYSKHGKPAVIGSITREEHFAQKPDSSVQIGFEYTGGLGEVIMQKAQAEPGIAKRVTIDDNNTLIIEEVNTALKNDLRWIGNGRTIVNNKGNAVKQFEPFFSVTWQFEAHKELVETGVTPIMYYDAAGRLVKTELPNGTFSKVVFDAWKQSMFDPNDTIEDSDWHKRRTDPQRHDFINDTFEQQAAVKAFEHRNTPSVMHLDSLGRPVLAIEHNKNLAADEFYLTKVKLDTEGNLRSVTDARGNVVMNYKYDMLGNMVYQKSMDAGQRWLLINIAGNPLRTWDERNHEFQYFYDIAHRPTHSKVLGGDQKDQNGLPVPLNHIFDRIMYGENVSIEGKTDKELNFRGQVYRHYDTGGRIETPSYDFKGQPLSTTRKLFKKYKEVANWRDENLEIDLEPEEFTFFSKTDALGRITEQIAPDSSVIFPEYNKTGLLRSEKMLHSDTRESKSYLKNIDYNEKGQRNFITYGNNVKTKFEYDQETFQLRSLKTNRGNQLLQDLSYTYDPVGNITHIKDAANDSEFFRNQVIDPVNTYSYDALYRLIEATGRENNAALNFGNCDNWNDQPFLKYVSRSNPMMIRKYTQRYQYDVVGNILEMKHLAVGGNWTRNYSYETTSNRLKGTQIGNNQNPANYTNYRHHSKHGYMEELPHLEKIGWNFKEEVVLTSRQNCIEVGNSPSTTYYQYDGSGQRIRKITENQASRKNQATKKDERIYIAGYEVYKKHSGNDQGLVRISLSLMDEGHRFVTIETRYGTNDGSEKHLVRYQLHNHLGSASLELDDSPQPKVISYEEYHPYGTTAYQAKNATIKASAKRYRYTGMERDEETGLEYHSARYYLPWLGRWLSSDPIGIEGGMNVYEYCGGRPLILSDVNGKVPINMLKILEGNLWESATDEMLDQAIREGTIKGYAREVRITTTGGSYSSADKVIFTNNDKVIIVETKRDITTKLRPNQIDVATQIRETGKVDMDSPSKTYRTLGPDGQIQKGILERRSFNVQSYAIWRKNNGKDLTKNFVYPGQSEAEFERSTGKKPKLTSSKKPKVADEVVQKSPANPDSPKIDHIIETEIKGIKTKIGIIGKVSEGGKYVLKRFGKVAGPAGVIYEAYTIVDTCIDGTGDECKEVIIESGIDAAYYGTCAWAGGWLGVLGCAALDSFASRYSSMTEEERDLFNEIATDAWSTF